MEKNEKISLQSILLLISALVMILAGGYIYKLTRNNNKLNNNVEKLENKTSIELQKTLNNFLEMDKSAYEGTLLEYLNIGYDKNKDKVVKTNNEDDSYEYVLTNIKFDDYKKAMLNYVTEDFFEREYTNNINYIKNEDGFIKTLKPEENDNKLKYIVDNIIEKDKLSYIVSIRKISDYNVEKTMRNFTLVKVDGKLVINTYSGSKTTQYETKEPTIDEITSIYEKYLKIDCESHTDGILNFLNIGYDENKDKFDSNLEMVTTNVNFIEYKNAMLNYVSENLFTKEYTENIGIFENKNGKIVKGQGGGECPNIKINKITKTGTLAYTADVIENFNEENANKTYKFTLKNYNGKLVIDTNTNK